VRGASARALPSNSFAGLGEVDFAERTALPYVGSPDIVEKNVRRPEYRLRRPHRRPHGTEIGNIERNRSRPHAARLELRRGLLCAFRADIIHQNRRALASQDLGAPSPKLRAHRAGTGTSDEHHPIIELNT
jgi:hypothetical protein